MNRRVLASSGLVVISQATAVMGAWQGDAGWWLLFTALAIFWAVDVAREWNR